MLIIRRLNCINAASGTVTLKISEWSRNTIIYAANYIMVILDNSFVFRVTIPDAAPIQSNPPMMSV